MRRSLSRHLRYNFWPKAAMACIFIIMFMNSAMAQKGDGASGEGKAVNSTGKHLKAQIEKVGVWLSLYAATYAGEYESEIKSIGSQAGKEEFESLMDGISMVGGRLQASVKECQRETGVRPYILGLVEAPEDNVYKALNFISESKYEEMTAPYVLFRALVTPIDSNKYKLSLSYELSEGLKSRKLNLPLAPITKVSVEAVDRKQIKDLFRSRLIKAVKNLSESGNDYKPRLSIRYAGADYVDGSVIKVPYKKAITLEAVNKEGERPRRSVQWEVGYRGYEGETNRSNLQMKIMESQDFELVARSGKDKVRVIIASSKISLDWKENLRNALKRAIRYALDELDKEVKEALEKESLSPEVILKVQEINRGVSGKKVEIPGLQVRMRKMENAYGNGLSARALSYYDDSYQGPLTKIQGLGKRMMAPHLKTARRLVLLGMLSPKGFKQLAQSIEKDLPEVAGDIVRLLIQGKGKEQLKDFLSESLQKRVDFIIRQKLGNDMEELYAMISSGADKEKIKGFISEKLADKAVNL